MTTNDTKTSVTVTDATTTQHAGTPGYDTLVDLAATVEDQTDIGASADQGGIVVGCTDAEGVRQVTAAITAAGFAVTGTQPYFDDGTYVDVRHQAGVTVTFTHEQAEIVKRALDRVSQASGDTPDDLLAAFYAHKAIWAAQQGGTR